MVSSKRPTSLTQKSPRFSYIRITGKEETLVNSLESTAVDQVIVLAGGSASLGEKLTEALEQEVISITSTTETDYFNQVLSIVQSKINLKDRADLIVLYRNTDYVDHGFISGLLKTLQLEQPQLRAKTIGVDSLSLKEVGTLVELLERERGTSSSEVRYKGGNREIREMTRLSQEPEVAKKIKEGGVYLITGGAGGIGKLFAEHIAKEKDTRVILTGRAQKT